MAFDHDKHAIDPKTGFQVDKETGHHVGVHQAPPAATSHSTEFPKWVKPHDSHVKRHPVSRHVSTPHFAEHHVDRNTDQVTVLVHDEAEEHKALSAPEQPKAD